MPSCVTPAPCQIASGSRAGLRKSRPMISEANPTSSRRCCLHLQHVPCKMLRAPTSSTPAGSEMLWDAGQLRTLTIAAQYRVVVLTQTITEQLMPHKGAKQSRCDARGQHSASQPLAQNLNLLMCPERVHIVHAVEVHPLKLKLARCAVLFRWMEADFIPDLLYGS